MLGSPELDDSYKEVSKALDEEVYKNKQISNTNTLTAFMGVLERFKSFIEHLTVGRKLDISKAHCFVFLPIFTEK